MELIIFFLEIISKIFDCSHGLIHGMLIALNKSVYLADMDLLNQEFLNVKISDFINEGISQKQYIYKILKENYIEQHFINIEKCLILLQKLFFECNIVISNNLYWYNNSKILINKSILNSINEEELNYNLSLDLLLDTQNEYVKNIIFALKKYDNMITGFSSESKKKILKEIYKNYMFSFKQNPYKLIKILKELYKEYPRFTFFNYGIDYDINIWKTKIYNNKFYSNLGNKLQDIDLIQYYFKNTIFEKKSINYKYELNSKKSEYLLHKYITDKIDKSNIYFDDINRSTRWAKLKIFLGLLLKEETILSARDNIFGGYSYWWSWHQDAFHIYGEKGNEATPIWKEIKKIYMKKYLGLRFFHEEKRAILKTGLSTKKQMYYGKWYRKLGARLYWEFTTKRIKYRFAYEGRMANLLEKKFFKDFLYSDDIWSIRDDFVFNFKQKALIKEWKPLIKERRYIRDLFATYSLFNFESNRPEHAKGIHKNYLLGRLNMDTTITTLKNEYINKDVYDNNVFSQIIDFLEEIEDYQFDILHNMRGYFMKKYIIDSYINNNTLVLKRKMEFNNIFWENFFINIENTEENLNLNYIYKNFYGRHNMEEAEDGLIKKNSLYSDQILPKSKNVLIKKSYIENLLYVYEKEEEPIKNYIYIKYLIKPKFYNFWYENYLKIKYIIYYSITDFFKIYKDVWNILQDKIITKMLEIRQVKKFNNIFKNYYNYIGIILSILFFILFYGMICGLLILIIKSYLPKNLIYGVKTKDKINFLKKIKKYWEPINLNEKLNQKNIFDFESRYIYRWNNRIDKNIYENTEKENIQSRKKLILLKKIKENLQKEINGTFAIFYKTFLFEKNLEKWENNTKIRADIGLWGKYVNNGKDVGSWWLMKAMYKALWLYYRDRRYNHNRQIVWNDPTLEKESKIIFYFKIPKLFFNIFFIFRFLGVLFQTWDYNYWKARWKQMVQYGVNARLDINSIRKDLEKEWTLQWYLDNLDFGGGTLYKDWSLLQKQIILIKTKETEVEKTKKYRNNLLLNIIIKNLSKKKQKQINEFQISIEEIRSKRALARLDIKFEGIREKLGLEMSTVTEIEIAEQEIMHKYREDVFLQKLALDIAETNIERKSYLKRRSSDFQDDRMSLTVIDDARFKKVQTKKKWQIWKTEYEKRLREENWKNNIIDKALDKKDKAFFEAISDFNKDISNMKLHFYLKEKEKESKASKYEKFVKMLYKDNEKHYFWFRWWTTMGGRLNYIVSLLLSMVTVWTEHLKKIRKNDYSFESLILIIKIDWTEFIYIKYWEYIILKKKYNTFKKFGYRIIDILNFSFWILIPVIFIIGGLNIIIILLMLYLLLQKKLYNNIIIKNIKKSIKYLNFFFKDINTGETFLDKVYLYFIMFCAFFQRHLYFIIGAFKLGIKQQGIFLGIKKVLLYLIYKYKDNKEYLKINIINIKTNIKIIKEVWILKYQIIAILWNIQYILITWHWKFILLFYKIIWKPIYSGNFIDFYKIYKNFINLFKRSFKISWYNVKNFSIIIKKLNWKEIIIISFQYIWKILKFPITLLLTVYKWRLIEKNKKGFQYILKQQKKLKKKKIKKNWQTIQVIIHNTLMNKKISFFLRNTAQSWISPLEYFYIYQSLNPLKNEYQVEFWKTQNWNFKIWKEDLIFWFIKIIRKIEAIYIDFEKSAVKNFFIIRRIRYGYYFYKLRQQKKTREKQRKISKDLFFYNKGKERSKVLRRYFIKGIINWITYITINKVFFVKIKKLKRKKIYNKYKIKDISENYHLGEYLQNTPPQLWSLVILYEFYLKLVWRYLFEQEDHITEEWQDEVYGNSEYFKKIEKWYVSGPESMLELDPPKMRKYYRIESVTSLVDWHTALRSKVVDPIIHWVIYVLEAISYEDFNEDLTDVDQVWGDISLAHLLTFNKGLRQYQYEILEFAREVKKVHWLRLWIKWNESKYREMEALEHKIKLELVETMLWMKTKNIMKHVLQERYMNNAKYMHNALRHYIMKSPEDLELDLKYAQENDYFYYKKKEFFEGQELEDYMDWRKTGDSREWELKTYNQEALFNMYRAHINHIDKKLRKGDDVQPLEYLQQHLIFFSFDQTLTDMTEFIKNELWQNIEKKLKKNINKKGSINYKHIKIVTPSILNNINATEKNNYVKAEIFERKDFIYKLKMDKILHKDIKDYYVEMDYKLLQWEQRGGRKNYIFEVDESDIIQMYFYKGFIFTYEHKIRFNEEAKKYFTKKEYYYNGHKILLKWANKLKKRRWNFFKNVQKRKTLKKKEQKRGTLVYINNIRWHWKQWLGYENIEKETKILDNNIIIFNEKYRLWNLKRGPIRLKLPIVLEVDEALYQKSKQFLEDMDFWTKDSALFILKMRAYNPCIKGMAVWTRWRTYLEARYNMPIEQIFHWLMENYDKMLTDDAKNNNYHKILQIFLSTYYFTNRAFFSGYLEQSLEMLRYYDLLIWIDDFDWSGFMNLTELEYAAQEKEIVQLMVYYQKVIVSRFRPGNYYWIFKTQYNRYFYFLLSIGYYVSVIRFLNILFYYPGFYIYNMWYLLTPLISAILFWFLRKYTTRQRDLKQGGALYLYRHKRYKKLDEEEELEEMEALAIEKERLEGHRDYFKKHEDDQRYIDPYWEFEEIKKWNHKRKTQFWHWTQTSDKDDTSFVFKKMLRVLVSLTGVLAIDVWILEGFRLRNSAWIWKYYKYKEKYKYSYITGTRWEDFNYHTRTWEYDSFFRLESGGNIYSTWYTNKYRRFQQKELLELDYGLSTQKLPRIEWQVWVPEFDHIIWLKIGYADIHWVDLSMNFMLDTPEKVTKSGELVKHIKNYKKFINKEVSSTIWESSASTTLRVQETLDEQEMSIFMRFFKGSFRQDLKDFVLTHIAKNAYTDNKKYNPVLEFYRFKRRMQNEYNYNVENNYTRFTTTAKYKTNKLIREDLHRYRGSSFKKSKIDSNILEIFFTKKNAYNNMEPINSLKVLTSINKNEKHIEILYYNFVQYKNRRFKLLLESADWQKIINKNHEKGLKKIYDKVKQKDDILYNKKLKMEIEHNEKIFELEKIKKETELNILKYEHYIKEIFKKISKEDILEYKYKIFLKLLKEKNWEILKDIVIDYSRSKTIWEQILEFIEILLKYLFNF